MKSNNKCGCELIEVRNESTPVITLKGDMQKTWTKETWKPIKEALEALRKNNIILQDHDILITNFRFEEMDYEDILPQYETRKV